MRVLFVIDTLSVGGAERSLLELANRLPGCQVLVLHPYRGAELLLRFDRQDFETMSFDLAGVKNELTRIVPKLSRVLASFRPDVVNSTLPRSRFACRAATRLRRVSHVENFVSDMYGHERMTAMSTRDRRHWRKVKLFDRATAWAFERGVAVSNDIKRIVRRDLWVRNNRIEVIERGRDPSLYRGHDRDAVRTELGIAPDAQLVISVGRLVAHKGQDTLLRAFSKVSEERSKLELALVGDGEQEPRLRRLAVELGVSERTHFLGTRADVPRLLAAADVFAFPSRSEGFGGALLEAMMTGLAIVATDIAPSRELVVHGDSALLSPPHDAVAFARNLLAALGSKERSTQLGREARRAAAAYDIERVSQRYRRLLEGCVS